MVKPIIIIYENVEKGWSVESIESNSIAWRIAFPVP
jgi:hypothetical protein